MRVLLGKWPTCFILTPTLVFAGLGDFRNLPNLVLGATGPLVHATWRRHMLVGMRLAESFIHPQACLLNSPLYTALEHNPHLTEYWNLGAVLHTCNLRLWLRQEEPEFGASPKYIVNKDFSALE